MKPAKARGADGRILPGHSGNPNGRPKVPDETRAALRAALPRAVTRLVELIESGDEKVALAAVQVVLNRTMGKEPLSEDDEALPAAAALAKKLATMTPEQLLRMVEKGPHGLTDGH